MENIQISPEELAAEQAALQEAKEEDIRESVITKYGFDEVDDAERIDKMVAEKVESNKELSQAIGQKIKHRADADELRKKVAVPPQSIDSEALDKKFDEKLDERFEKRDLEVMDYPDELKVEIQKVAKTQGISIKKAAQDPYIVFKIGEYEKEQKTEEASVGRTNKSGGKKTYSFENPPEPDMSTPEGRAEWDAYKVEMKRQGN